MMCNSVLLFLQQQINAVGPIISVGVFVITLSASLANLIGATKILHAVAKDKLFGKREREREREGGREREREREREGGEEEIRQDEVRHFHFR